MGFRQQSLPWPQAAPCMLTLKQSFVKVIEQMSVINFINYSLSTAAEGFMPSHAPLKNNKHLSILFSRLSRGKEKTSQNHKAQLLHSGSVPVEQREGVQGRASILSVMPNVAPDISPFFIFQSIGMKLSRQSRNISAGYSEKARGYYTNQN